MIIYIRAQHPQHAKRAETIDEAQGIAAARDLINEYRIAYGPGWTFTTTTRKPKDW